MKRALYVLIPILLVPSLSVLSCASLQRDVHVSAAGEPITAELVGVSARIVALDAPGALSESGVNGVRETVTSLERSSVRDAAFEARLAAWSGRLFLLEGKRVDAEAKLRRALQLDATDVAVIVLKSRLEGDPSKRLSLLDAEIAVSDDPAPLIVEKALTMVALSRYRDAVALFDDALPRLPRVYAETYRAARDGAWTLRDARDGSSGAVAAILPKASVTWRDTLDLALAETDLLAGYLSGSGDGARDPNGSRPKQIPRENADSRALLFGTLIDRGIVPSVKFTDGKYADGGDARSARRVAERMNEPILRADAAWFLWHLYAGLRDDPALLSRYSRGLSERRVAASPVPDVPTSSPFFDSVLGCVEWEFMSLLDGVSFAPERPVDGASLLRMLRKIRK